MEVLGSDGKKFLWEVVDSYVIEEETDHDEIGLRGFNFNFFDKYEKGVGREGSIEFPYLLMLIKLWIGYYKNRLNGMNMKVGKDNGKEMGIGNGWYRYIFSIFKQ